MSSAPPPLNITIDRDQRNALLDEAARLLDERWGVLGAERTVTSTAEGESARDFKKDIAELGSFPDVYKIDDQDYVQKQLPVPFQLQSLLNDYRFYWIRFPIGLSPRQGWSFNRLEILMEFTSPAEAHARPKVYRIFPDKKFDTLFQMRDQLQLGIDENLELVAKTGSIQQQVGTAVGKVDAGASVKIAGGIGFMAGPFVHTVKVAKIDHNGTGMDWVRWQLDGAEFAYENTPDLVIIAQVPKTVNNLGVNASMVASRYFSFLSASLQKAAESFPEAVKALFHKGLPISDKKSYDLTPVL